VYSPGRCLVHRFSAAAAAVVSAVALRSIHHSGLYVAALHSPSRQPEPPAASSPLESRPVLWHLSRAESTGPAESDLRLELDLPSTLTQKTHIIIILFARKISSTLQVNKQL